ncbi:MAG TPA: hypothetical protein VGV17_03140 [Bosea sp. (in: a-proteobacteria)]|jgi:hypothetical protein|uniref:hypothetical protein n=1 Tax=Bosea sp. (in: a-proteobacteria) TaxID=1871050 RepID=UPI002DDCA245|nr:hypothetical protein [Bosea sp. (in: a-proteobacteria)]HEV2552741.1 hypothetical protein [Bosea sp. (in: a-proteobacteria)]
MIAQTAARPSQPVSPRRDAAVVARMADFLLHRRAGDGSVTREDLLLDFTEEQIDTHLEAAKAQARKSGKTRS